MKSPVYPPNDKSNLWLPAFQTLATSGKEDSSFSSEIRIGGFSFLFGGRWEEGKKKACCGVSLLYHIGR